MRAYSTANEEAVQARELLKDWAGEGLITEAQYRQMEQETVCDLKRTNIFLRFALGFFTVVIVMAVVGLFFVTFEPRGEVGIGLFLLLFGAASYGGAEFGVARYRLHRYGVEEALLICSAGLLCAGLGAMIRDEAVPATAGAVASIWIWRRFGLWYAVPGAMACVLWLADGQRLLAAGLYVAGLAAVMVVRGRHRFTFLDQEYSIAEALLWLGVYAVLNLQLSFDFLGTVQRGGALYWATYVFIWSWPPVVFTVGLRKKDRFVIWAGAIAAIATLVTNKPYLGWPRHTWDPMLLGVLLVGVALFVRKWLAAGADEVRKGFTARRLSGRDKRWVSVGATAAGLASANVIPSAPEHHGPEFGGGASGGGGASSDF